MTASWSGDFVNVTRQASQVHMMVEEPGTNAFTIEFDDTPSGELDYNFYPAFHA